MLVRSIKKKSVKNNKRNKFKKSKKKNKESLWLSLWLQQKNLYDYNRILKESLWLQQKYVYPALKKHLLLNLELAKVQIEPVFDKLFLLTCPILKSLFSKK